jgi:hypothetical protein
VKSLRDHLAEKRRELWIWGDRLIDGREMGVGMWEGSFNETYTAIDMIPKDVVICDWHYDRPDKTALYFAKKGFRDITCPWRKPDVALIQLSDMIKFRKESNRKFKSHYLGVMETVWSSVSSFFDGYYGKENTGIANQPVDTLNTPWNTFKTMYDQLNK